MDETSAVPSPEESGSASTTLVRDEEHVYHFVTSSQLTLIEERAHNRCLKAAIFFSGLALALLKDFVPVMIAVYSGKVIEILDAFSAFVFVGSAAAAISLFSAGRGKNGEVAKVLQQVRACRYEDD